MRTLYHYWLCPFSRKIRLMLHEKKLEFQPVVERIWEHRPQFVSMNPEGLTPVFVEDDGKVIANGYPIAEYLEEIYYDPPLLGDTSTQRAETRRLVAWFDEKFNMEVTHNLVFEKTMKRKMGLGGPDSGVIRAGQTNIHDHLAYIGWLVDQRNWLSGHHFSLADITAAAHLSCIDYLDNVPWDKHPEAKEWYTRMKSRPSFRAILQDTVPGITPAAHYMDLDF
ncbi:Glutathione S-transferase family protein [Candidatus Bealeia paramacronuclearis]|uniref:Glutathione S-transferase family protein n=1 Tax=Candidatus Bealeia paramacronuclearis TaxID=1921001 RepID=A0ABZ2C569_9PROT|nr:Glutathione S-transferase family protein [Candidatus Bealeia paramacronuclearis]